MKVRGRHDGLLRANLAVASGTAMSRLTGLLRIGALTYAIGAGPLGDVYNRANSTPNILYELILGGVLSATLVPLFTEQLERDDEDATSAIVTVAMVALAVVTIVAVLAAPWIIDLYTPGDAPSNQREVGTTLARIFLLQVFFYGMIAVGSAMLNARKRFFAPAWAPVLNNVVVVAALLALPHVIDAPRTLEGAESSTALVLLLGFGTTGGIAVMALALLPALRRAGVRLRFHAAWGHPAVAKLLRLSGWTFGYVAANQIALFVVYKLAAEDIAEYQYAFVFFQLPHGLLAVSIMTTFAPDLARAWTRDDGAEYARRATMGLRATVLLVLPASVGLVLLARPVVFLLRRGAFDAQQAATTADILAALAAGLAGFSAYLFVLRCFYARGDTRTPFWINLGENALNIALALALVGPFGVRGLAWSYSIAYLVFALVALAVLVRRVPHFQVPALAGDVARLAAASAVMGVAVWLATMALPDASPREALVRCLVGVLVGVAVYGAALVATGMAVRARA